MFKEPFALDFNLKRFYTVICFLLIGTGRSEAHEMCFSISYNEAEEPTSLCRHSADAWFAS